MAGGTFTTEQALAIAERIGLDFDVEAFPVEEFRRGLEVEMEHGAEDDRTNVTDDAPDLTGKIAWAHLNEFPDYYTRLDAMEAEAHRDWEARRPGASGE
ncbi:MAG: hypothetical protein OEM97_08890 [Acidimicrobiia bacterium]|nr:hypothetical protein [Acidimicrobiia bacterium]